MNLTLLRKMPQLVVYYDSWNNWLFLDWHGNLTLAGVQAASLALIECCPYPSYQRVLNSNAGVTYVPGNVTAWLGLELLPLLQQVGIEQIAWVRAACATGRQLVERALDWLPTLQIAAFDDLETAMEWLQRTQPPFPPTPRWPLAPDYLHALTQHTQGFVARITAQLASSPEV